MISYQQALQIVRDLNEEPGVNPEYERGQVELLSDLYGSTVERVRIDLGW